MYRAVIAITLAAGLLGLAGLSGSIAQEPRPEERLCAKPDPARAINLALNDDGLIIAIAQALGPRDLENGTPVRIIEVVEGDYDREETIADRRPVFACASDGVWDDAQPVVGVFRVQDDDMLSTLAWWLLEPDGRVRIDGQRGVEGVVSVEELLDLGRSFIEPTPTPLPPGVSPPPTIVPPHAGPEIDLPTTGQGPESGRGWLPWLAVAATGAALVTGAAAVARRR